MCLHEPSKEISLDKKKKLIEGEEKCLFLELSKTKGLVVYTTAFLSSETQGQGLSEFSFC